NPGDDHYEYRKNQVAELQEKLNSRNYFNITFRDENSLKVNYHQKKSIIRFYEATRQAIISSDGRITSLETLTDEYKSHGPQENSGIFFERYLVTTWNYALLQKGLNKIEEASKAEKWIERIIEDLKQLFEDPTLTLEFDIESLRINIKQEGKEKYRLDQLSSGFSSILSIYADLLVRVELGKIERDEISGIVLVDEIDAHLHVTLQKKVFSFFKSSFPNIQFIISTHSPFVVQSVSDAIIFNLTTLEQMEDLSLYSYTSIIKGLLGERSSSSILLEKIEELSSLMSGENFNDADYIEIMSDLEPFIQDMDARSQAIILSAKNKFIEKQQG
ncbi:AAA family ATPase, partial [Salmonella enterica]|nr:AAA family ATPase [Salmonella enterica]EDX3913376.1 AAA family ATPase [Salmonella enterica subsp. enterica serovar Javiana]ECQ2208294.1 AAA family ATPase [Salmonella enterica]EDG2296326.1 AAA family ATPase [Salmonella enterica]EDY7515470.1 AAA family ATPase [Salmonella enterica]